MERTCVRRIESSRNDGPSPGSSRARRGPPFRKLPRAVRPPSHRSFSWRTDYLPPITSNTNNARRAVTDREDKTYASKMLSRVPMRSAPPGHRWSPCLQGLPGPKTAISRLAAKFLRGCVPDGTKSNVLVRRCGMLEAPIILGFRRLALSRVFVRA